MALAAACVAARLDVTTVTVDHGLQDGSASVAARTAALCTDLGAHACTVPVTVEGSGRPPPARPGTPRWVRSRQDVPSWSPTPPTTMPKACCCPWPEGPVLAVSPD